MIPMTVIIIPMNAYIFIVFLKTKNTSIAAKMGDVWINAVVNGIFCFVLFIIAYHINASAIIVPIIIDIIAIKIYL